MTELQIEIFSSFVSIVLTFVAAGLAYALARREYYKKLEADGKAVVSAYMATIEVTNDSISKVLDDDKFFAPMMLPPPPDAVYDFRAENWFSVHDALCSELGKLVHINEQKGTQAIHSVSLYFQEFKYTRELFAHLIAVKKAAALLGDADPSSQNFQSAKDEVNNRVFGLKTRLKDVQVHGRNAMEDLGALLKEKPTLRKTSFIEVKDEKRSELNTAGEVSNKKED